MSDGDFSVQATASNLVAGPPRPTRVAASPIEDPATVWQPSATALWAEQGSLCLHSDGWQRSNAGSCFVPHEYLSHDADSPGIRIYQLGLAHRTWANQGTGTVHYLVRAAFQPTSSSAWLAVRWRGAQTQPATLRLLGPVLASSPLAQEPVSGWNVFLLAGHGPIQIEAEFDASSDHPQNALGLPDGLGYISTKPFKDVAEVVEFDDASLQTMRTVSPLRIGDDGAPNGLLSFVGGLALAYSPRALALVPTDNVASKALTALEGLLQLGVYSTIDLSQALPPGPATSPWQQRQAVLKASLPALLSATFAEYGLPLERDVATAAATLGLLDDARKQLSTALAALARISAAQAAAALCRAAHQAGDPDICPTQLDDADLEVVETAVIGAEQKLAELQDRTAQQEAESCMTLAQYVLLATPAFPVTRDPAIARLCDESGGRP
jgi:hypothetical protein